VSVWVVVVAAGSGRRFGAPKHFAPLGGRALVQWAVDAARPVADGVVLVLPADADGDAIAGVDAVVTGGATRAASVRAGLAAVPESAEVIVVHDGARPLASPALFRAVVDAVAGGADAAVPAVAVADTLKQVVGDTASWRSRRPRPSRPPSCAEPITPSPRPPTTPAWSSRWGLPCASCPATPGTSR
jgi:2-C-methyl-D-erythritol 4-phosphate cytidylyltransferase